MRLIDEYLFWLFVNIVYVKCVFVIIRIIKFSDNVMLDKWIVYLVVNEFS